MGESTLWVMSQARGSGGDGVRACDGEMAVDLNPNPNLSWTGYFLSSVGEAACVMDIEVLVAGPKQAAWHLHPSSRPHPALVSDSFSCC